MDYSGLDNGELSLVLATEIVKKQIDNDWDFSDEGTITLTLRIAEEFYTYLENH